MSTPSCFSAGALLASLFVALPALADSDGGWVSNVSINGPTVQIYGGQLVHPHCQPGPAASKGSFLRVYLGETQLQVVAASSNQLSLPPDYVQANLPSGSRQLVEGSYALSIFCGSGLDSDDEKSFTAFVSYAEQNLNNEISRALTAEGAIAASLAAETARAQAAEAAALARVQALGASVAALQAAAVTVAPVPSGDPSCPDGGTRFSAGGAVSYACNGAGAALLATLQAQVAALQALVTTQTSPAGATVTQIKGPVQFVNADARPLLSIDANGTITAAASLVVTGSLSVPIALPPQASGAAVPVVPGGFYADASGVRVRGLNLYVTNGLEGTKNDFQSINGSGNLLVGINAPDGAAAPAPGVTGSHNIILGDGNSATSHGAIVGGQSNVSYSPYASVLGGYGNQAGSTGTTPSSFATVVGGSGNAAQGLAAVIGGGLSNSTSGRSSTVSGGEFNQANGDQSSVSGGHFGQAGGVASSISGGNVGVASGAYSSVGGGHFSSAGGDYSTVAGGEQNSASGLASAVHGGLRNSATNYSSSVCGGSTNVASGNSASVSGGVGNNASGDNASISGGAGNQAVVFGAAVSGGAANQATGISASVCGGYSNTASGNEASVLGGYQVMVSGDYQHSP